LKLKKEEFENEDLVYYIVNDSNKKPFGIKCVNHAPFNAYQVGDYVEINLNVGKYDISLFSDIVFNDVSKIRKVEGV
jgi:hypothetical protein